MGQQFSSTLPMVGWLLIAVKLLYYIAWENTSHELQMHHSSWTSDKVESHWRRDIMQNWRKKPWCHFKDRSCLDSFLCHHPPTGKDTFHGGRHPYKRPWLAEIVAILYTPPTTLARSIRADSPVATLLCCLPACLAAPSPSSVFQIFAASLLPCYHPTACLRRYIQRHPEHFSFCFVQRIPCMYI